MKYTVFQHIFEILTEFQQNVLLSITYCLSIFETGGLLSKVQMFKELSNFKSMFDSSDSCACPLYSVQLKRVLSVRSVSSVSVYSHGDVFLFM